MTDLERFTLTAAHRLRSALTTMRHRLEGEVGEGVISAAIVVLIMAIIGAAMWAAFNTIWSNAESTIRSEVNSIGG